ncbi:hypothetical protein [Actinoplanes solisilvae]|uniref:hypothetical protein n=1 Tax=Actinoplanes solisilvae TaxID=2486853 RepID=UPI000FD9E01D|nr:hypothetical protein [Actinoplanes solisilvae]
MTTPTGTYTFLPWLRRGVANRIETGAGDPAVRLRAGFDVELTVAGDGLDGSAPALIAPQHVSLYGPGDITGLDAAAISRLEPPDWTTNFEANHLVAIEFYEEDLPWRYTPAAPDGRRLLPWMALIVLAEPEFKDLGRAAGQPLGAIELLADPTEVASPPDELWAWAHVHLNAELAPDVVSTDTAGLADLLAGDPDLAASRLLCPRKLAPATAYHAFLVPAFESGRLAGLGLDPEPIMTDPATGLTATSPAWDLTYPGRPAPAALPFYHRWYFRTGTRGDFEDLVRVLQPRVVDSLVGTRDLDVSDPAPGVGGIAGPDGDGVLRLGGALRAPRATMAPDELAEAERFEAWAEPYPHPFQQQLAAFLNLSEAYARDGVTAHDAPDVPDAATGDDPVVVPPIYGRWPALTERLLTEADGTPRDDRENWLHELNLDPRWRVAAGFGTDVVRTRQEELMAAAWAQIGAVLEANDRIRQAQLALRTSLTWHAQLAGGAGAVVTLTAPLHRRVVDAGLNVLYRVRESPVRAATVSTTMRRLVRPTGRLTTGLGLDPVRPLGEVVDRVNEGELHTAPPKAEPAELPSPGDLADAIEPTGRWARLFRWLRRVPWPVLVLAVAVVAGLIVLAVTGSPTAALVAAIVAAIVALVLVPLWLRLLRRSPEVDIVRPENQTAGAVDALPGHDGFTLRTPVSVTAGPPGSTAVPRGDDNPVAVRFKDALRDVYRLAPAGAEVGTAAEPVRLALDDVAAGVLSTVDPVTTVPAAVFDGVTLPPRVVAEIGERFVEAMAYPEFDTAMYEPLLDVSDQAFVPGLDRVEPNSVTLLETDQRFIEAYLAGLNHEFARELLWREYPTDQRGSYFRQFWDVRTQLRADAGTPEAREALKDIPPLHLWPRLSGLGEHDNREAGRANEEELVLVIRGELLKKYPNAIISAQPARWQPISDTDPSPDKAKERRLDESKPVLTPLYEARVRPDIFLFGFDLTALTARGDDTVDDQPGWFFRIEEVPGDARFGFDTSRTGVINVYNDLIWDDIVPGGTDGDHVTVAGIPPITLIEPAGDVEEKHEQWENDRHVPLNSSASAAELAYVALQVPVLMAVHAAELLPDQG